MALATRDIVPPKTTELDPRILREALIALAEATGQGAIVCDAEGKVLFTTGRAKRLVGTPTLPQSVVDLAHQPDESLRISLDGTPHSVIVRVRPLPGPGRHLLVLLAEEAPRGALTKGLVERFGLSARSVQLVQLTSRGLTNREIAERLHLSEATVKTYMHGLFREIGVRNRAELVALAERMQAGVN